MNFPLSKILPNSGEPLLNIERSLTKEDLEDLVTFILTRKKDELDIQDRGGFELSSSHLPFFQVSLRFMLPKKYVLKEIQSYQRQQQNDSVILCNHKSHQDVQEKLSKNIQSVATMCKMTPDDQMKITNLYYSSSFTHDHSFIPCLRR